MSDRKYELGHEKLGRLLFKYSTPAAIAMLVNSMYNLVDTIFVGKSSGTMALAGLAVSFPVQMIIMAVAQTIGIGSASIISRSLGAGNQRKAERVAGASFIAVFILGLIWTVLGLIFLEPLLRLFGANDAILPYAKSYMSVILLGAPFFGLAVSSNNLVRSEGNAKTAMNTMLVGASINIILDPIFIFGFKMGIRGAAVATVIAQLCGLSYLVIYFLSGKSLLKIRLADVKLDFKLLGEIVKIGAPSLTRTAAGSFLSIILNNSLAYYGSEIHIAILGVLNRLMMFIFMPLFGIIQGLQPIVGFNYGARKIKRVKQVLNIAIGAATAVSIMGFLTLTFLPDWILKLFTDSPEMIREALPIIRIIALAMPLVGFQAVGASLFQALGKAGPALFLSMSRHILFLIPLMLILPLYFKLHGVIYAFPISDLLSTMITFAFLARELKNLTLLESQPATG